MIQLVFVAVHSSESKTRRKSLTVTGASSMVGAKAKRSSGAMDDLHTMPLHVERHVPFEGSVSMSALPTPALSIDSGSFLVFVVDLLLVSLAFRCCNFFF